MGIVHRTSRGVTSGVVPALQARSDASLIEAVASGDERAMRELYKRYNVYVYRFIRRLIGDRQLTENLVGDVFLEVWRHADHFEGRSKVSTWLLSISRFKALSELRHQKAERAGNIGASGRDQFDAGRIEDAADNPEDAILRKDACALMRDCVNKLSPEHREIIDLIYYGEKTVEEVAQIIRAPKNTVKTRAYYARRHLEQLLAARKSFDPRALLQAA
jgi:RNA polymerase sigma-70 factor, ECF subfamily